jgi:hypothetical protein
MSSTEETQVCAREHLDGPHHNKAETLCGRGAYVRGWGAGEEVALLGWGEGRNVHTAPVRRVWLEATLIPVPPLLVSRFHVCEGMEPQQPESIQDPRRAASMPANINSASTDTHNPVGTALTWTPFRMFAAPFTCATRSRATSQRAKAHQTNCRTCPHKSRQRLPLLSFHKTHQAPTHEEDTLCSCEAYGRRPMCRKKAFHKRMYALQPNKSLINNNNINININNNNIGPREAAAMGDP